MNKYLKNFNRDKWTDCEQTKTYSIIGGVLIGFIVGWVFLIPAAVIVFLAYGGFQYIKERKEKKALLAKPVKIISSVVQPEWQFKDEKEKITHEVPT